MGKPTRTTTTNSQPTNTKQAQVLVMRLYRQTKGRGPHWLAFQSALRRGMKHFGMTVAVTIVAGLAAALAAIGLKRH